MGQFIDFFYSQLSRQSIYISFVIDIASFKRLHFPLQGCTTLSIGISKECVPTMPPFSSIKQYLIPAILQFTTITPFWCIIWVNITIITVANFSDTYSIIDMLPKMCYESFRRIKAFYIVIGKSVRNFISQLSTRLR